MKKTSPTFIDLVLCARAPVLGKVKKRLAVTHGDKIALAVYRKLLRITIRASINANMADRSLYPIIFHMGPCPNSDIPADFQGLTRAQTMPSITENLAAALESSKPTMVIGTDHPTIKSDHIVKMAALLKKHQVVVGPADDGGFWALATKIPLDKIIRQVPMSTPQTCNHLTALLDKAGVDWATGPTLWDLDTAEDLERFKKIIKKQTE